jgi:hypothetical protein
MRYKEMNIAEQERCRRQINKHANQVKKRIVYKSEFMEITSVKENADSEHK